MVRRIALACLVTLVVVQWTAEAAVRNRPERIVPCGEAVDVTPFPFIGSAQKQHRFRLVLGAVSVPPAYLPQTAPTSDAPWRYFSKRGMVVRAGTTVTVTVPRAWRQRVGISWGNGGHGVFHTIRIVACASLPRTGSAYAGGFFLRAKSACVPLVFAVGSRRATVWFGVGQRCR